MRIIILGANGQIGSRILTQLLQDYPQATIIGCVRPESLKGFKLEGIIESNLLAFDPFKDDWNNLGKVDVLINSVGIIEETPVFNFTQVHIGLINLMLQNRERIGNPKLIQVSALGANVNSMSSFLQTKGQADQNLLQNPNTVVIRPSIVCTPNTTLSRKLKFLNTLCQFSFGVIPFPELLLSTRLQPVMVKDLTAVLSKLCQLDDHSQVIELGGREIYTVREMVEMLPDCRKIIPFSKLFFERVVPLFARVFPSLIDQEQMLMLQQDNITSTNNGSEILGRDMASTYAFLAKGMYIISQPGSKAKRKG